MSSENFVSFSFGFRRSLTNREMTDVASLLSFLEGFTVREGKRDARVWIPNPNRGFSCNSLFGRLLDPAPSKESVFYVIWRIKVPKKVSSLYGKSCLVGFTLLIGLSGLFVV